VEPRSVVAAATASEEVVEQDGPAWPCINCGATVPMAADVCPECGKGFLAGLVGTTPTLVLPVVGDITTKSPAQRYAIAAAIGLSAAVLVVGLVALIGSIF
jgi:ribosomal protein L40E